MEKRARREMISMSNQDRISELPEPILHKILYLLPPEEAITTAILSKAWRNRWINIPCLDLSKKLFNEPMKKKSKAYPGEQIISREKYRENLKKQFLNFVDDTLTKRLELGSLAAAQTLHLYAPNCRMTQKTSTFLDRWIVHGISDFRVEELSVDNSSWMRKVPYKFPGNVFVASRPSFNLKVLSLRRIQLDQEMIDCLATTCPLVQSLCFDECSMFHTFKVSGFSKLDKLVLNNDTSLSKLVIDAPNLDSFDYNGKKSDERVPTASILFEVTAPVTLRYLRICRARCSWSPQLFKLFSNVENLVLDHCGFSSKLVISSKCLKSCTFESSDLVELKVNAPNLKYLRIAFLLHQASSSSYLINYSAIETGSFFVPHIVKRASDLVDFLMKSKLNPCENLELQAFWLDQELVIPPHLRKASYGLLSDVKHLTLHISSLTFTSWKRYSVREILETILWLCPNPLTISLRTEIVCYKLHTVADTCKVLKFKYFEEDHVGAHRCNRCKSLPVLCWQHYIEEVSISSRKFTYTDGKYYQWRRKVRAEDDIIKAFFENAREEEKIIVNSDMCLQMIF